MRAVEGEGPYHARRVTSDIQTRIPMDNPYGFCPECGQPGTIRARDMIATTFCANKHGWVPMKGVAILLYHTFVNGATFVFEGKSPNITYTIDEVKEESKKRQAAFTESLK